MENPYTAWKDPVVEKQAAGPNTQRDSLFANKFPKDLDAAKEVSELHLPPIKTAELSTV